MPESVRSRGFVCVSGCQVFDARNRQAGGQSDQFSIVHSASLTSYPDALAPT